MLSFSISNLIYNLQYHTCLYYVMCLCHGQVKMKESLIIFLAVDFSYTQPSLFTLLYFWILQESQFAASGVLYIGFFFTMFLHWASELTLKNNIYKIQNREISSLILPSWQYSQKQKHVLIGNMHIYKMYFH